MCNTASGGAFTDWPDTGPALTRTITGLSSGKTYQIQVQAENAEGKGPWSDSVNGTTLTAPTVVSVAFTSTPASAQNNIYKLGDVIEVTATFSEAVTVTGTPQIDLTVGSNVRQANYQSGSTTTQLLFQYTVQATDEDTDGATINANGLKLNGGSIVKNNSTIDADLAHGALTSQSSHKVDGVVPTLTDAEVTDDKLTLTYSEVLDNDPKPATGDFAVTVAGGTRTVNAVGVSGSEVMLTLASVVTTGETVTLTYTPGTNQIRDLAQNPAVALANRTVTNPLAPELVAVYSTTDGELEVRWSSSDFAATTGFKVQWKSGTEEYDTSRQELADPATSLVTASSTEAARRYKHTITRLTNGIEYTVRVLAADTAGDSDPSPEAAGTPQSTPGQGLAFIENEVVTIHEDAFPWLRDAFNHLVTQNVPVKITNDRHAFVFRDCPPRTGLKTCLVTEVELGRGYPRLVDVTIHELGHVYSLANLVTNKPGSVGMAHVYFSKLDTDPQEERCYPEELYADMLKILTLGERSTIDHYWSRCVGTNESLMEAALAVVRSATSGEVPTWWTDTYDNSGGTPDLEAFWADVKATSSRSKATAVPYQLRNLFGGYCDEANAAASVPYAIVGWVGDGPTRNPWRDSGCVPEAPGDPTAVAVGSGELTVYWAPPAGDGGSPVEGYKVQWKSGSEEYDPSRQAEVTDLANLSYTISDLTSDVEYTVQVLAYNTNGTGAASAEATETATAGSTTLPKVNSVAISSNPGTDQTYAAGDEIQVTVTFSETVTVTGSPQLTLNVGGEDRTAGYERVTGSALVFSYRVDDGERDTEGVSIKSNSISLNGGMIKDSADDHDALLNHRAVAADAGHKVDGVKPKLAATGGAGVNGIVLALTFDEPLHLWLRPEAGDFTVTGGDISRTVTDVGLSGSAVLLILDLAVEHGEEGIRVSYTPGMNPIRDVPGNEAEALSLVPVTNETPDTTVPGVSGLEITSNPGSDATYAVGDEIEATVTFNETVEVEGTPQLRLRVGSRTRTAGYRRGTDTTELVFAYEVADGDEDTDGVSIEAGRIALNGGTIKDEADNPAELAHEALSAQAGHKVDGVRPAFVSAAVDGSSLALTYGEVLDNDPKPATGDFAVTVDGTVRSVTEVGVSGSAVTLTLASAVTSGQTVKLTYTPGTNPIRDLAQNPAAGLTNRTVPHLPMVSVCDRTTQVRDAIVAKAPVSTCGDVTAEHLAAIIGLKLISKNITVLKAGDFSGLTALRTLALGNNNLITLPANIFSDLTALEGLALGGNQLSTVDANLFSGLTALQILVLSHNQLSTVDANLFSGLTALQILVLSHNQLSTVDANLFSGLTALEYLDMQDNGLSSLPEDLFSGLTALKELYLHDNKLSSLQANVFFGLTALEGLRLHGNDLSDLPANLFSGLTALKELYLHDNKLSSLQANVFFGLTALEELYLYHNKLSSLQANVFSGLTALKKLDLKNNNISTLPANVFSNLSVLDFLSLYGNQLSTVDASAFSGLTALEELYLHDNKLSDLPANVFSDLTALEKLHLSDNKLSSLQANVFSGLTALQRLQLEKNAQQLASESVLGAVISGISHAV